MNQPQRMADFVPGEVLPPQYRPEDHQIVEEVGEEDGGADEERKFVPGAQDYSYERRMSSP